MKDQIRAYCLNLLDLFQQFKAWRAFSFKDEEAKTLADTLEEKLEDFKAEIKLEIWEDWDSQKDAFEGKAIRSDILKDKELMSEVGKFLRIKNKIEGEISKPINIPTFQPEIEEDYLKQETQPEPQQDQTLMTQKEKMKNALKMFELEYEIEKKKQENALLKDCVKETWDLDELNQHLWEELDKQGWVLLKADDDMINAAEASAGYLSETKKKSKRKWGYFSLKHGLWGGVTGAAAGGLLGLGPGAAFGATTGALTSGYVAGKLHSNMIENIENVEEQKPEFIRK